MVNVNNLKKIIIILGPTASGKSDLAIKLARKLNGEVISADSRQVYRGMDIGSGKITKAEQKMAKHYLLDKVSPKTEYNVANFKKDTQKIIDDILSRGKLPIICGGTGFWISAIVDDIKLPEVKPNKKLRKRLEKENADSLYKKLKRIDPERAKTIDKNNKIRLIRSIEICQELGNVPQKTKNQKPKTYEFIQFGIDWSKEKLNERIKIRLDQRFRQGMIAEVKRLHAQAISWKRLERFGLEYRWIARFLQRKISKDEMKEELLRAIKKYAKRQRTWFKRDKRIHWFILDNKSDANKALKEILKLTKKV